MLFMPASCGDMQLRLTHEQLRICNYNMSPGEVVKIVAFAGRCSTVFGTKNDKEFIVELIFVVLHTELWYCIVL